MKKTLSILAAMAAVGSLGVAVGPAFAATRTALDKVPYCDSTPSDTDVAKTNVIDELNKAGASVITAERWNGCIQAVYSLNGHTSMVYVDPDSLQVVSGVMPKAKT